MPKTFPGTTVELCSLEKGSSRQLFDGIFATGGITLSQLSIMTGLEPYLIQNWIKRGFVSPSVKRLYSRQQFARILIINMLRETLQIERICHLLSLLDKNGTDRIGDEELYHRYVDLLAEHPPYLSDPGTVQRAAESAGADLEQTDPFTHRQLLRMLQILFYAHTSASLRHTAEALLATLE